MRSFAIIAPLLVTSFIVLTVSSAASPTPEPTPVLTPTAPPDLPVARFSASAWVDARPSWEPVEARIGDMVCGGDTYPPVAPPGAHLPSHHIEVVSDSVIAGCGKPGATITFFVGGRRANETAIWYPSGESYPHLDLVVGAPFGRFYGDVLVELPPGWAGSPSLGQLVPFIGGVACGYQFSDWRGEGPAYGYMVVVYSRELKAGCGSEGAEVTFKMVNRDGSVAAVARETGVWRAMGREEVDLTLISLAGSATELAKTGEGGAERGSGPIPAAVGLAAFGLMAMGVGLALRRRARL